MPLDQNEIDYYKSIFNTADIDKDGFVTIDEIQEAWESADVSDKEKFDLDSALTNFDTDEDRRLSLDEWMDYLQESS